MQNEVHYSPEIVDIICNRIAEGQSVREIGRTAGMPAASTIFRWLAKYEDFRAKYLEAKDVFAEVLAEEILDIADNANNDWMRRLPEDEQSEGWQLNGEHIARSRIRIDARKWIAGKLKPKKYGDRMTVAGDEENPIPHKHNLDMSGLTDEQLRAIASIKTD